MKKAGGEGKRGMLSRRLILETGLRLVDAEGVESLSMRRLASELGVFPTALYYYVPSKEALMRGIVELVLAEVELPGRDGRAWEERIRVLARSFRGVAHAHPRLLPRLVTYPEATPQEYGIYEALYDALEEAGLDAAEVVRTSILMFSYVTGFTLAEASGTLGPLTRAERDDLAGLPHEMFPATRRLTPHISGVDLDENFEFGINILLSGFAATAVRGVESPQE